MGDAAERVVLARGTGPDGTTWTVTGHGDQDDYYTFIRVEDATGHPGEGGFGGPPLYPGNPINVYRGWSDEGPQRLLVRADPAVARIVVHVAGGAPVTLRPVARVPAHGVVVFAGLLPRDLRIEGFTALDAYGDPMGH